MTKDTTQILPPPDPLKTIKGTVRINMKARDGIRFYYITGNRWRAELFKNGEAHVGWGADPAAARLNLIDSMQIRELVQ